MLEGLNEVLFISAQTNLKKSLPPVSKWLWVKGRQQEHADTKRKSSNFAKQKEHMKTYLWPNTPSNQEILDLHPMRMVKDFNSEGYIPSAYNETIGHSRTDKTN